MCHSSEPLLDIPQEIWEGEIYLLNGRTTHRCSFSVLGWRITVPTTCPYATSFQSKLGWRQVHRKQVPRQQLVLCTNSQSFSTFPLFALVHLNVYISRWLGTWRSNLLLDNGIILLRDFLRPENTFSSSSTGAVGCPRVKSNFKMWFLVSIFTIKIHKTVKRQSIDNHAKVL